VFAVNWWRKDAKGNFLWPGFGENSYVLKWIVRRTEGKVNATRTAIGYVPTIRGLEVGGLSISTHAVVELLEVKPEDWFEEVKEGKEFFKKFPKIPPALKKELDSLEERLHIQEDQPPTHNKRLLAW
jgi:phosphoenolpyruvate carboxykinase (GTP)